MGRSALVLATLLVPVLTCGNIYAQSRETTMRSLYQLEGKVRALEHVQFQLLAFIVTEYGIDASKAIVSDAKTVLYEELDYCDEKWDKIQPSQSPSWDDVRRKAMKILNKLKKHHCAGARSAIDRTEQAVRGIEDAVKR